MRLLEIEDNVYDKHKLQNQREYENQKKINEIKIGDDLFTVTCNVIKAIEEKMRNELKKHNDKDLICCQHNLRRNSSQYFLKLT